VRLTASARRADAGRGIARRRHRCHHGGVRVFLIAILASGCYLHHESTDVPVRRDAGHAVIDAGHVVEVDAGHVVEVDAGGSCDTSGAIAVRVEPITMDRERCDPRHVEGALITGVDATPNGIRIHADYCPGTDADCRCDLVVTGVGSDLTDAITPATDSVSIDWAETFISIQAMPRCRCDGCACSLWLVFYAASTLLTPLPFAPPELTFAPGAEICPAPMDCESPKWLLRATTPSETFDVVRGADVVSGAIHVRSVRDVDLFAPCADCALCGTPQGGWVTWAPR
jgi:hypothetical protein